MVDVLQYEKEVIARRGALEDAQRQAQAMKLQIPQTTLRSLTFQQTPAFQQQVSFGQQQVAQQQQEALKNISQGFKEQEQYEKELPKLKREYADYQASLKAMAEARQSWGSTGQYVTGSGQLVSTKTGEVIGSGILAPSTPVKFEQKTTTPVTPVTSTGNVNLGKITPISNAIFPLPTPSKQSAYEGRYTQIPQATQMSLRTGGNIFGTYDPFTGTYTSSKGETQTRRFEDVPGGTTIITGPTPRGGGGDYGIIPPSPPVGDGTPIPIISIPIVPTPVVPPITPIPPKYIQEYQGIYDKYTSSLLANYQAQINAGNLSWEEANKRYKRDVAKIGDIANMGITREQEILFKPTLAQQVGADIPLGKLVPMAIQEKVALQPAIKEIQRQQPGLTLRQAEAIARAEQRGQVTLSPDAREAFLRQQGLIQPSALTKLAGTPTELIMRGMEKANLEIGIPISTRSGLTTGGLQIRPVFRPKSTESTLNVLRPAKPTGLGELYNRFQSYSGQQFVPLPKEYQRTIVEAAPYFIPGGVGVGLMFISGAGSLIDLAAEQRRTGGKTKTLEVLGAATSVALPTAVGIKAIKPFFKTPIVLAKQPSKLLDRSLALAIQPKGEDILYGFKTIEKYSPEISKVTTRWDKLLLREPKLIITKSGAETTFKTFYPIKATDIGTEGAFLRKTVFTPSPIRRASQDIIGFTGEPSRVPISILEKQRLAEAMYGRPVSKEFVDAVLGLKKEIPAEVSKQFQQYQTLGKLNPREGSLTWKPGMKSQFIKANYARDISARRSPFFDIMLPRETGTKIVSPKVTAGDVVSQIESIKPTAMEEKLGIQRFKGVMEKAKGKRVPTRLDIAVLPGKEVKEGGAEFIKGSGRKSQLTIQQVKEVVKQVPIVSKPQRPTAAGRKLTAELKKDLGLGYPTYVGGAGSKLVTESSFSWTDMKPQYVTTGLESQYGPKLREDILTRGIVETGLKLKPSEDFAQKPIQVSFVSPLERTEVKPREVQISRTIQQQRLALRTVQRPFSGGYSGFGESGPRPPIPKPKETIPKKPSDEEKKKKFVTGKLALSKTPAFIVFKKEKGTAKRISKPLVKGEALALGVKVTKAFKIVPSSSKERLGRVPLRPITEQQVSGAGFKSFGGWFTKVKSKSKGFKI